MKIKMAKNKTNLTPPTAHTRGTPPLGGNKKIFIIAGEVSGDVLGAKIMAEMDGVKFVGIGGENMKRAGLKSLFPISDLSVMGLVEVLANARTLTRRINETADAIIRSRPDIVLTIDSPSFVKRVIKKVKHSTLYTLHSTLFYHVVAPQVWAWRPGRAREYAKIFDRLYAFFDFEKPYFTKYGLDTIVVGHPIADGLRPSRDKRQETSDKVIALIPGSRMSEVKKLLPLMKSVAECVDAKFFIPTVETTKKYIESEMAKWRVKPTIVPASKRYDLFAKTDIAIAASGTVSAELAIMHVPAIVVYKMNFLTTILARLLVRVKWVSLVNILLNKTVYPELLGPCATAENIICEIEKLSDLAARKKMISELSAADKLWHRAKPASEIIAQNLFID